MQFFILFFLAMFNLTSWARNDVNVDNEALFWAMEVNNLEIGISKRVIKRLENPEVKAYAQNTIDEYSENLKELKTISKSEKLKPKKNKIFNKYNFNHPLLNYRKKIINPDVTYVDAQLEIYKDLLNEIDFNVIPKVESPKLKTYLVKVKNKMESSLLKSKSLRTKIL